MSENTVNKAISNFLDDLSYDEKRRLELLHEVLESVFSEWPGLKSHDAKTIYSDEFEIDTKEIPIPRSIQKYASENDIEIVDYGKGLARDPKYPKRLIRLGKLLPPDIRKEFMNDPNREFMKMKNPKFRIALTFDLAHVITMSYGRRWNSCFEMTEEGHPSFFFASVMKAGVLAGYIINSDDLSIKDPYDRFVIKAYFDPSDNKFILRIREHCVFMDANSPIIVTGQIIIEKMVDWVNRKIGTEIDDLMMFKSLYDGEVSDLHILIERIRDKDELLNVLKSVSDVVDSYLGEMDDMKDTYIRVAGYIHDKILNDKIIEDFIWSEYYMKLNQTQTYLYTYLIMSYLMEEEPDHFTVKEILKIIDGINIHNDIDHGILEPYVEKVETEIRDIVKNDDEDAYLDLMNEMKTIDGRTWLMELYDCISSDMEEW